MGGAKLLGEGSGGRLRPSVGPGQSPGRGARGAKPPGSSRVLKFPKKSKIKICLIKNEVFYKGNRVFFLKGG